MKQHGWLTNSCRQRKVQELFHRLSDSQNRELRDSQTDLHTPLLRTSSGQKSFASVKYVFRTTLHMKQKQVNRSPPLKQN